MFNSPILQVAIGMIFFYLLLSLICSALNEMIEAVLNNRANDLEHGIRRLLDDPNPKSAGFWKNAAREIGRWASLLVGHRPEFTLHPAHQTKGLASRLYEHALIRCLYVSSHGLPSYIPARNFALALMDLVAPGQNGAAGTTRLSAPAPSTVLVLRSPLPSAPPAPASMGNVRLAIQDPANVPSTHVRQALLTLMDSANDDAIRVRENIEGWFNSTTERISGWYKRRTQVIILVLGVLLSMVLNADSVLILDTLWHNSALSSSIAAQAESYSSTARVDEKTGGTAALARAKLAQAQLSALGLPIGWSGLDDAHRLPGSFRTDPRRSISWALYELDLHWLGWLITGLAISLGAPFWFDILNKFIVVRSTVKPKEKSQEEPSKD